MYKDYKKYMLILLALTLLILFFINKYNEKAGIKAESDININTEYDASDFTVNFGEPIFYEEEELIYFEVTQTLTNPLFIGGDNTLIIEDNNGKELLNEVTKEGDNYFAVDMTKQQLSETDWFKIALYNGSSLVLDGKKFTNNVIYYEDLSDYNEEGKSKEEKRNEVTYFIYTYINDPLLSIKGIDKYDPYASFEGNTNKQHKYLVSILDDLEFNGKYQDQVIEYYKSEIPKVDYEAYYQTKTVSEQQQAYTEITQALVKNLEAEINGLELELVQGMYMNNEDIENLVQGKNLLKQKEALQSELNKHSKVEVSNHEDKY